MAEKNTNSCNFCRSMYGNYNYFLKNLHCAKLANPRKNSTDLGDHDPTKADVLKKEVKISFIISAAMILPVVLSRVFTEVLFVIPR
jgi:hypothetical protein